MDAASLRAMTRPALQKLAKENSVKANLKSHVIIELLLARQITKLSPPHPGKNNTSSSASSKSTSNPTAERILEPPVALHHSQTSNNSADLIDVERVTIVDDGHHSHYLANDAPQSSEHCLSDLDNVELQYPSSPAYTFGTPESSMPGTPEPEAPPEVLEDVVRTMALIDEQDIQTLNQIATLRNVACKLRSKAEDLRAAIRAERARRQRIEKYVAYWRIIDPEWSFEDVWEGKMRVYRDKDLEFEVTSTDDERMELENQQHAEVERRAGEIPPVESGQNVSDIIATLPSNARFAPSGDFPIQGAPDASPARSSAEVQKTSKRSGDGDAKDREENLQYQHYARSEEPETRLPLQPSAPEPLAEFLGGLINGGALEISMQPAAAGNKKEKRHREDAENAEDCVRYRSRPRLALRTSSGGPVPASSRTQAHVDKGKGKMTPAQMEELLQGNRGQWELHAQNNRSDSRATSTDLREQRDRALALVVQTEEYSGQAVDSKSATFPTVSSPPKPTRRSTRATSRLAGL